jgi:hypothetical protein
MADHGGFLSNACQTLMLAFVPVRGSPRLELDSVSDDAPLVSGPLRQDISLEREIPTADPYMPNISFASCVWRGRVMIADIDGEPMVLWSARMVSRNSHASMPLCYGV